MVLAGLRGAIGFLSRLPVGTDSESWQAFRSTPVVFPLAGYAIGGVLLAPFVLPIPEATTAVLFVAWVYTVTGITHLDGLADLADAAVVHGSPAERRSVMTDTTVGVGAVAAVGIVILGLAIVGMALATRPPKALGIVIAAEVGAKLGMATITATGTAAHQGLGSQFTTRMTPRSLVSPVVVALPVAVVTWPHPAAAGTLLAAIGAAVAVQWWARRRLGGVSGDVIGAGNELARLAGLHAGVIVWSLA